MEKISEEIKGNEHLFDNDKDIIIDETLLEEKPAWEDEEDKQLLVDLNKTNRLKKLKSTENESKISGLEFSRRLKKQYEKLQNKHDLLKWAESSEINTDANSAIEDLLKQNKGIFSDFTRRIDLLNKNTKELNGGILEVERLKDANIEEKSEYFYTLNN